MGASFSLPFLALRVAGSARDAHDVPFPVYGGKG